MLQRLLLLLPLLTALLPAATALAAAEDVQQEQEQEQDQRALLQRKAALEARIDSLQQELRSDDPALQETWLELGSTLQQLQQHAEAAAAFDAAWQAARSSGGLENPQQLDVLRRLLASQRAAEEWEKADATAHLMQHIGSRALPPGSDTRLDTVLQLGRWKLLAARDELLPNPLGTALSAADLFRQEITRLEALPPAPARDLQLATLHLEKASAAYLVAERIRAQPLQDYFMGGQRSTTMLQCQLVRLPDGRAQQVCMPVELPNLDFYVDPSNRKNQDIARQLEDMRSSIAAAFGYLQQTDVPDTARDTLLDDMRALTVLYNEFASNKRQVSAVAEDTVDATAKAEAEPKADVEAEASPAAAKSDTSPAPQP